jgi:hypothetical protein
LYVWANFGTHPRIIYLRLLFYVIWYSYIMKFSKMTLFITNQKQFDMLLILLDCDDATVKKRVYIIMSRDIDNRIVLKMLGSWNVSGQSNDSILSSDMIDSSQNVQKLAALVRDREWSYFYSHTGNEQDRFGAARLRKWLCEKAEQLTVNLSLNETDYEQLCNSFHLAIAVQIIRTKLKVGQIYMKYIITSQEHPLEKIEKHWWRWEYQAAKGDFSHIHCLLWTTTSIMLFSEHTLLQ